IRIKSYWWVLPVSPGKRFWKKTLLNCFDMLTDHQEIKQFYSSRKLSTGLAPAARNACQLTVANAIATAVRAATANTHHSTLTWYAKSFSQRCINHQAAGKATKIAMTTSLTKSDDSI